MDQSESRSLASDRPTKTCSDAVTPNRIYPYQLHTPLAMGYSQDRNYPTAAAQLLGQSHARHQVAGTR